MMKTIPVFSPDLGIDTIRHLSETLEIGWLGMGKVTKEFEERISEFLELDGRFVVATNTATSALHLALRGIGVGEGDEVITPSFNCVADQHAIKMAGGEPVMCDILEENLGIDCKKAEELISEKTKAIIPVNLYGQKVDLKKLRLKIGKKISIIEDAAQSHFAYSCYNCSKYSKNKCCKKENNGSYADISCYSFYPSKNIGAYGDGGLVATNNKKLYKKLLALRNLGSMKKHEYTLIGLNSRLDTLQAAVLKQKLKSILKLNECRRKIAKIYDNNLNKIKEINLTKTKPGSARHLYVIRTKKRDSLQRYLKSKKIYCQIHYPYSLNKLKPFKKYIKNINLRNSEQWSKECISLPMHPNLQINQVYRVVYEIMKYFKY